MINLPSRLWKFIFICLSSICVTAYSRSTLEEIDRKHIQHKEPILNIDQPSRFPHLEAIFKDLDGIISREDGDQVKWSSISEFPEQVNYYKKLASDPGIRTVCEVGFGAGFSSTVWLVANTDVKVYSFGLRETYARSCTVHLQTLFPNRLQVLHYPSKDESCNVVLGSWLDKTLMKQSIRRRVAICIKVKWGNSMETLPLFVQDNKSLKCDLVHIDGEKALEEIRADFTNIYQLLHCDTHIVVNDVCDDGDTGPTTWWSELQLAQVVEETEKVCTSAAQLMRTPGHHRGHNRGFAAGRLKCAMAKPPLPAT